MLNAQPARLTVLQGTSEPRPSRRGPQRWRWGDFRDWFYENFELGEHVSVLAPTGGGKSHLIIRGLAPLFLNESNPRLSTPVLFLDAKDNDPLLAGFGQPVDRLPGKLERWGKKPWWRLRIPSRFRGVNPSLVQRAVYDALRMFYREGGVIIADEVRPILRLRLEGYLVDIWERGRSQKCSLIAGSQAARWMPSHMYDQANHTFLGRVTDQRARIRFREIGGYSDELRQAIAGLKRYEYVFVSGPYEQQAIVKCSRNGT